MNATLGPVRAVGIHLVQNLQRLDGPGLSAVTEIGAGGALAGAWMCRSDEEILTSVGHDPALVLVDAPLVVPDGAGRRDVEHVLAWLDIPAFPVSRTRMQTVYGGARAADLAARLVGGPHVLAETIPDQVLRQLMWEREQPPGAPPLGLAEYRARWRGVRPPAFRPRGGRAHPEGLAPAHALLAGAADLTAWPGPTRDGDLAALDEAAAIDATACAVAAHRCLHGDPTRWVLIGTQDRGRMVLPGDLDLAERATVNATRLASEGVISIPADVAGQVVGAPQSW